MSTRLFINDQESVFFDAITKELLQVIVGQKVIYFAVSEQLTHTDQLYGEALRKTVYTPIEVNALVLFQDPEQTITGFTLDTSYRIEVYFQVHELFERNIKPREGDFLRFGNIFYEMEKVTTPQITYGEPERVVQIKCICRVARNSQFLIDAGVPVV